MFTYAQNINHLHTIMCMLEYDKNKYLADYIILDYER